MSDRLLVAPDLKLYVNGHIVGYASGLSYRITQGQKMIFGVDSPFPQEIAQGASPSFVNGQMTVFRPGDGNPEIDGMVGPRTIAQGESQDPQVTLLGAAKYSTLELRRRDTGNVVLRVSYTMFGDQNWQLNAKGIFEGVLTFQGILASQTVGQDSGFTN